MAELERAAGLVVLAALVFAALRGAAEASWRAGFAAGFSAGGVRLTHDEGVPA